MMNRLLSLGLLLASFSALALAGPASKECVAGLKATNGETYATLIDYAEFQKCTDPAAQSCAMLESSYRAADGVLVNTQWFWGCINEPEVLPWIDFFTSHAVHGIPHGATLVSAGNSLCQRPPCNFDYTLPDNRDDGLTCHANTYVVDDETGAVVKKAPEGWFPDYKVKCKTHQPSCEVVKFHFTLENGRAATEVTQGCTDNYDYGYDRYYPTGAAAADNKKFCEANKCMDWFMGCICWGDEEIAGRGKFVKTTCNKSLCNVA